MNSNKRVGRGRGRGVLALTSYEPCPRPSKNIITHTTLTDQSLKSASDSKKPVNIVKPLEVNNEEVKAADIKQRLSDEGMERVLAKYNYKANADRPGGFDELTIVQGEKLTLLNKGHKGTSNDHWWEVKNDKGEIGFAPQKYLLILEQKPTNLPWLENKRLMEEQERKEKEKELTLSGKSGFGNATQGPPKVKQYLSAYNCEKKIASNAAEAAKMYYCEICDKNLNGPQPYKMHMASKAHREEVEYKNSS